MGTTDAAQHPGGFAPPGAKRNSSSLNWQGSKLFLAPAVPCSLPLSLTKSLKGFHLEPHIPQ